MPPEPKSDEYNDWLARNGIKCDHAAIQSLYADRERLRTEVEREHSYRRQHDHDAPLEHCDCRLCVTLRAYHKMRDDPASLVATLQRAVWDLSELKDRLSKQARDAEVDLDRMRPVVEAAVHASKHLKPIGIHMDGTCDAWCLSHGYGCCQNVSVFMEAVREYEGER